jgi:hypothetical protein
MGSLHGTRPLSFYWCVSDGANPSGVWDLACGDGSPVIDNSGSTAGLQRRPQKTLVSHGEKQKRER